MIGRRRRKLERVATWNAKVGRGWRAVAQGLREIIAAHDPEVIVLQEAMHYVVALRLRFLVGWKIYAPDPEWEEARNCPIMVRRDVPHRGSRRRGGWGWVRMRIGWKGPKHGLQHPGRTWTWVVVDGVPILDVHRVTGGPSGGNRASYAEEGRALVEWFKGQPTPALALGDFNGTPHDGRPGTPKDVAHQVGARVVFEQRRHPGPGIDYAITRGLDAELERHGRHDSDHRVAVLTIRRRRDTLREQMS